MPKYMEYTLKVKYEINGKQYEESTVVRLDEGDKMREVKKKCLEVLDFGNIGSDSKKE